MLGTASYGRRGSAYVHADNRERDALHDCLDYVEENERQQYCLRHRNVRCGAQQKDGQAVADERRRLAPGDEFARRVEPKPE